MSHRELLPIPPIETATDPVHSAADLRQRWRALMGPLGFGERLLWFAFVGPDRCLIKILNHMPIKPTPSDEVVDNLMSALQVLLSDFAAGTTVALLLTRPGPGPISNADRGWSAALVAAAVRSGVPHEPIFRANDESLVQVAPDLTASRSVNV